LRGCPEGEREWELAEMRKNEEEKPDENEQAED